ncbi:MAG TPA: hypothetical protein VGB63_04725 [Pedobacter sp.]|jgi:hypothetical protein
MKLLGCTAVLLLFFFHSQAQKISFSEKRTSQLTYIKGQNFEGVIFAKDFVFPFLDNESGDKRFTPSIFEIEMAEKLLNKDINFVNLLQTNQGYGRGPIIHKNLTKYARQYFGYYTPQGEKIIYISCLLKSTYGTASKESPTWLRGAVLVLNGGSNYWQVQANLNKSTLFGLDVNGLDKGSHR